LGFDDHTLTRSVTAVPDLQNDPRLAKIADHASLGLKATVEIGSAA